jgi:osmotically-inducible protein OsmY
MRGSNMKVLRPIDQTYSPLVQEEELRRRLRAAGVCDSSQVRLTMTDGGLFIDGFVTSVDEKSSVETVCRQLAPAGDVVNRLRVAAAGRQQADA